MLSAIKFKNQTQFNARKYTLQFIMEQPQKNVDCLCNGSRYDHIGNIITEPTVKRLSRYEFE